MKNRIIIFFVALLMSCIDPISIRVRDASGDLVVEAWIYDRAGESYVKLSSTATIGSNPNAPRPVSNAVVELIDQQNTVITFEEQSPGNYKLTDPLFKAEVGIAYVLRIVTDDNTLFESDAEVMQPSLDGGAMRVAYAPREFINRSGNVSFEILVDFIVDVINPVGRDVYYSYEWEGTYTALSPFQNRWEECPTDGLPDDYKPDFDFEFCYISEKSNPSINILTTEGLVGDVFRGHKLASLNPNKRFLFRYSMLAKQYSLSRRAYNYLKAISDQTDNVGSLFDPPPSIIPGNIRSVSNSDKKVFGYFFVSSVNEFRDFFDGTFIPVKLAHYETCDCYPGGYGCPSLGEPIPVFPYCCDCRLIPNSTTVRPDFWIN